MTGMERLLPSYDMRLNQPFGPVLKPWDLLTRAWASTNAGHGLSANPGIGRRGGAAAKHKTIPQRLHAGFYVARRSNLPICAHVIEASDEIVTLTDVNPPCGQHISAAIK